MKKNKSEQIVNANAVTSPVTFAANRESLLVEFESGSLPPMIDVSDSEAPENKIPDELIADIKRNVYAEYVEFMPYVEGARQAQDCFANTPSIHNGSRAQKITQNAKQVVMDALDRIWCRFDLYESQMSRDEYDRIVDEYLDSLGMAQIEHTIYSVGC